jgi:hypothetical protein
MHTATLYFDEDYLTFVTAVHIESAIEAVFSLLYQQ